MTKSKYVFPGIYPFVKVVARRDGLTPEQEAWAQNTWHVKRIQDALGQLSGMEPRAQKGAIEHLTAVRDSLSLALDAVDNAIDEALIGCGLVDHNASPEELSAPVHFNMPVVKPRKK